MCTRYLSKVIEPNKSASLKAICERYNIRLEHHRALGDAQATLEILKLQNTHIPEGRLEDHLNTIMVFRDKNLMFIPKHTKRLVTEDGCIFKKEVN